MKPPKAEALPLWFQEGNCTNLGIDAGIMVPEVGDEQGEAQARVVCIECPVQQLCLAWALKNRRNDMGVYGAKTQHERDNLTRKVRREHGRARTSTI